MIEINIPDINDSQIDRKKTQAALEGIFKKYCLQKYTLSSTFAKQDEEKQQSLSFCEMLEGYVNRLPEREKELIKVRYMNEDHEYITNYNVHDFKLDPPISAATYITIRWRAFYKLALAFGVLQFKENKRHKA